MTDFGGSYVQCSLAWLIERADIKQPSPFRRLNGIENTLSALDGSRSAAPIDVGGEIRLAHGTFLMLQTWITEQATPDDRTHTRLQEYSCTAVQDYAVPIGFIRLRIATGSDSL